MPELSDKSKHLLRDFLESVKSDFSGAVGDILIRAHMFVPLDDNPPAAQMDIMLNGPRPEKKPRPKPLASEYPSPKKEELDRIQRAIDEALGGGGKKDA